jgi:hypothetical protein
VEAAVEAQRAHASARWPDDATVRVRMGLHTGEPALGSEGYLGLDVVRAARICTAARGGNVLLSETTRSLVGSSLPEGVSVSPLGQRQLKDIDQPEQVYELAIEGVETETAEQSPSEVAEPVADFRSQLSERIKQRVDRELRAALEGVDGASDTDDEAVDELAGRTADLGDQIAARVNEALRKKGL